MNTRSNLTRSSIALATLALLGACATTVPPPPELAQARDAVQRAQQDPGAMASAPLELKKASETLARAEKMQADRGSTEEIRSVSYVAERQAMTAIALADAKRNEDAIAGAQVERERARADARTAEARRAQMRAAAAQNQAAAAQNQAASAEQRASIATATAIGAQQQAADADQRAAAAAAAAMSAQQQAATLQQMLTELKTQETDRGTLVTLGDVLFEFGRAEVKPSAQGALRKLADFLNKYPDRQLLIEGHTDSIGSASANMALSQRRAEAVAAALSGLGVSPQRVRSVGYGASYPVAGNTTDTDRALNRRVEVYISSGDQAVRGRG